MKRILLMSFIFIMSVSFSFGQLISEGDRSMSQGYNNAFSMELREADKKNVEKLWQKYAKDFKGKTKKDKKTGEFFTDNGKIKRMGNNDMDIYAQIEQVGDNARLSVWFDLGGAYLNSADHESQSIVAENLIMDFALLVTLDMLETLKKEEEKTLKGLENDLGKLQKDKAGYEKDIADAEDLIEKRKADIEQNIVDQENKAKEIDAQKGVVQGIQGKIDKID
ncbi:MAG: hypothetical protein AAF502_02560 [Bacteroidota bacterium]